METGPGGKKIVYRVGHKMYTKKEIKFLKEVVKEKDTMSHVRLGIHILTTVIMVLAMIALCTLYYYKFFMLVFKNYDPILARVNT